MTNTHKALAGITGLVLGILTLVIGSSILVINKEMEKMNLEKQIKHDLILTIKDSCNPVYPVVHAAVYLDRIVVECRTE